MSLLLALVFKTSKEEFAYFFMGFFLVIFSLFKFVDYPGFVRAFQQYDILTRLLNPYAYAYPFIELFLGIGFLSLHYLKILNVLTIIVMALNVISVGKALFEKRKINCACLGTVIQLPLTAVSLFEALFMIVMAVMMF